VMSTALAGSEFGRKSLQWNAAMAVVLALSGVYSVVAFAVARRRREIAIRVALGGSPLSIVVLLLVQALRPAFAGLAVGLILSALLSRTITLMLYGVNPLDPLTYTLTTIALCVAAATASCVPAIRATRASSVAALKAE
jgi:putative ABC transport system permease protein